MKTKVQILPPINNSKPTYLKRYLVGLAVLLIICQSVTVYTLSWTIQNPQIFKSGATQLPNKSLESVSHFAQNIIDSFKKYLENHPYSSPISSTTFTSLLVLYYENTNVQLEFSPEIAVIDNQDHYQNLYHYLFFAKIPHPPQNLG